MSPVDPKILIRGVRKQDRRLLSKTITLIESSRRDHQQQARQIVDELLPYTGNAVRLGITGVPGVGKSTFIESLGIRLGYLYIIGVVVATFILSLLIGFLDKHLGIWSKEQERISSNNPILNQISRDIKQIKYKL